MSRNLIDVLKNPAKVLKGRAGHDDPPLSAAERAQLTLDSIGDAVISTNLAGNITYLNPVAESMTGWLQKEAAGRPLPEVLRILDSQTREPALNPLAMAMLHNKTVGL